MKWASRFALAAAISIMIAFVLSWLTGNRGFKDDGIHVSSRIQENIVVNDYNLVDALSELRLNQDIRKVDWRHSLLVMDLKINPNLHREEEVFADLQTICEFAFEHTTNIKEVLIRVVRQESASSLESRRRDALLLSMDATREQWDRVRTAFSTVDAETRRLAMDVYFKMIYTDSWQSFMTPEKL